MGNTHNGILIYLYHGLKSSMEQSKHKSDIGRYGRTSSFLPLIDLDINRFPLHNISMDAPNLSKGKINKGICINIYKAYLCSTWYNPRETPSPKLHNYLDLYLQCSDGLIQPPRYTRL